MRRLGRSTRCDRVAHLWVGVEGVGSCQTVRFCSVNAANPPACRHSAETCGTAGWCEGTQLCRGQNCAPTKCYKWGLPTSKHGSGSTFHSAHPDQCFYKTLCDALGSRLDLFYLLSWRLKEDNPPPVCNPQRFSMCFFALLYTAP